MVLYIFCNLVSNMRSTVHCPLSTVTAIATDTVHCPGALLFLPRCDPGHWTCRGHHGAQHCRTECPGQLHDTHNIMVNMAMFGRNDQTGKNCLCILSPCCSSPACSLLWLVQVDCAVVVGFQAVYRMCLVVTLFFLLMALVMIGVRTSSDPRAGIQNGFWGFKYLLIIGWSCAMYIVQLCPENWLMSARCSTRIPFLLLPSPTTSSSRWHDRLFLDPKWQFRGSLDVLWHGE